MSCVHMNTPCTHTQRHVHTHTLHVYTFVSCIHTHTHTRADSCVLKIFLDLNHAYLIWIRWKSQSTSGFFFNYKNAPREQSYTENRRTSCRDLEEQSAAARWTRRASPEGTVAETPTVCWVSRRLKSRLPSCLSSSLSLGRIKARKMRWRECF